MRLVRPFALLLVLLSLVIVPSMAQESAEVLTVYSGRSESLVAPIIEQFTAATGVQVEVLYGDTAALASQLIEEGENSPADVYFAQDGGAFDLNAFNPACCFQHRARVGAAGQRLDSRPY